VAANEKGLLALGGEIERAGQSDRRTDPIPGRRGRRTRRWAARGEPGLSADPDLVARQDDLTASVMIRGHARVQKFRRGPYGVEVNGLPEVGEEDGSLPKAKSPPRCVESFGPWTNGDLAQAGRVLEKSL
jgi:hypothetical protein